MIDRVLRFPLTTDQVIPTSYSQSNLGTIDEWSSTKDFTLKSLLERKNDRAMINTCLNDLLRLLACIYDQAQRVPSISRSHVVKKMPN